MPHVVIEYSANLQGRLQPAEVVALTHRLVNESGLFAPEAVKTRIYCAQDFHIGTRASHASFVHVDIAILDGRTLEQKRTLTQSVADGLWPILAPLGTDQFTVNIRDMVTETYQKRAQ